MNSLYLFSENQHSELTTISDGISEAESQDSCVQPSCEESPEQDNESELYFDAEEFDDNTRLQIIVNAEVSQFHDLPSMNQNSLNSEEVDNIDQQLINSLLIQLANYIVSYRAMNYFNEIYE